MVRASCQRMPRLSLGSMAWRIPGKGGGSVRSHQRMMLARFKLVHAAARCGHISAWCSGSSASLS